MKQNNTCPVCEKPLIGREDKVYCSSSCRGAFHYEKQKRKLSYFKRIERQLKLNRKILRFFKSRGKHLALKKRMIRKGFSAQYYTHVLRSKTGEDYFFCFDFGYRKHMDGEKSSYLIVSWKDLEIKNPQSKALRILLAEMEFSSD